MASNRPELGVTKTDPHVTRSEPTVTVIVRERFGHQVGDVRNHRVSRTGETIAIYNWSESRSWTFKRGVAEAIRDALTQVLDWTDDEPVPSGEGDTDG